MMKTKRKRCPKLTREQRELVYAPPESNAGAGWGNPEKDYRNFQGSRLKKKAVEVLVFPPLSPPKCKSWNRRRLSNYLSWMEHKSAREPIISMLARINLSRLSYGRASPMFLSQSA